MQPWELNPGLSNEPAVMEGGRCKILGFLKLMQPGELNPGLANDELPVFYPGHYPLDQQDR